MKSLLAPLCFAALVVAQDPAAEVAVALARRDGVAASRAAASAGSPALRARLQAALQPPGKRAIAMLAVARAFRTDAEADRALVAGAAAVLEEAQRVDAVPELRGFGEHSGRGWDMAAEALARTVLDLRGVVAARHAAGGDAVLLQEADHLLSLACVSRFGLWPVRVSDGASWRRPPQLAEPLQLRLLPCGPGHLPWHAIDSLGAPLWSATLPATGPFELPSVPRGDWLLEARSTQSPWRAVRRVLVSDLESIALTQDGHVAVVAFDAKGAAAAQWELWQRDAAVERGELGAGPALVRVGPAALAHDGACELRLRGDAGTAWLDNDGVAVVKPELPRWLAHAMVDRPIYRPGENVQGRVVLRTCRWEGSGLAQLPMTAPAADLAVRLIVRLGVAGERSLPLQTDARGLAAFSFVVPADVEPGAGFGFAIELPETDADGVPRRLGAGDLCGIANYRRQAVRLDVEGPDEIAPDAPTMDVVARAEWASGGPAAGLDVSAQVNARDGWEREETLALRTDADGRATVRVPVASLGASWISVHFTVTGPDGRAVQEHHLVKVKAPDDTAPVKPDDEARERRGVPAIELEEAVVGAACRITLRGTPGQRVLLVVGRSSNARVRFVRLGDDGGCTVDEPVLRCDWPHLDVAAATTAGHDDATRWVRLRPMRDVVLDVPEQAAPGTDATLRAHTDAPGALVTFAVVDERIYEIVRDATPEPDAALRPWIGYASWREFEGRGSSSLGDVLDSLLRHGRLPPLDYMHDLSGPVGRSAGGMAGPSRALADVRSRFCPTAHFATVLADAQGTATTSFRLPDDLTRWRATAVVIGPDGVGTIARKPFASRQPLAAEPVMPRALRAGDTFALPVAIDRAADAAAPNDVAKVTATVVGDSLAVERPETAVAAPAGRVVATAVPLRALAAGETTLRLDAQLGEHGDRSERVVVVGADRVARTLAAAAAGTGEVTVALPAGASPDAGIVVDVLQGGAEAWRLLDADLAQYPYGCVEQTLSRLVPYFALARAAKMRGETPPAMDEAFGKRLRAGLARLRCLQPTSSRQFAFWPDQEPDRGITGLVLHGLAMLRDGGFDVARSGLDVPAYYFTDPLPQPDGVTVVDAAFVGAAEQLAGELRLYPQDDYARRLLQPAVDVLPRLPAGLCARLGLALHGVGDDAAARACRQRLQDATPPALLPDGFPGEDPLAVMALRLELDVALRTPAAECERAAAELLLACLRGGGSTYGRSCALAALALVLPRTDAQPGTVVVEAGGERRELAIGGASGAAVRCSLPRAADVVVRGPAGMPLLVRTVTERTERASDHAAWAAPIRVERQWCTVRPDATWEERRDGRDLVPIDKLLVGRPLVLRLVVQSPVPMRHVVVDCPLPAGFELPRELDRVERFDDRVAFACELHPRLPTVLRLDVVPTTVGRFVWPPAVAAPMYVSSSDGGTAGAFVEVAAVEAGAVPSSATCLTGPRPATVDEPPDQFAEHCATIARAFDYDEDESVDDAARRRTVEMQLAELVVATGGWHELELLTATVRDVGGESEMVPGREWRLGAVARMRAALVDRTTVAFAAPWPADRDAAQRCAAILGAALGEWPAGAEREPWLAQWWQRARVAGVGSEGLLQLLPGAPTDPDLCASLREIIAAGKRDAARGAWNLLSAAEREPVPASLVLDALGADHEGVLAWLMAGDAGRAELRVRLRAAEFVRRYFTELQAALPASMWAEVPLASYEALAVVAASGGGGSAATLSDVVARVAAAPAANAELQQACVASTTAAWRFVLASALRARGTTAGDVAKAPADDPALQSWAHALRLSPSDAAGAIDLLAARRSRQQGVDLAGDTSLLARFVAPIVVAAGSPEHLYAMREWLDSAQWCAAWSRLESGDRVALLAHFKVRIGGDFVPATADEAEAVWQFLMRSGDVDGGLASLLASPSGVDSVRRHLAAGDAGSHADEVRSELAEKYALDRHTLSPIPGEELRALGARLARMGLGGAWTPEDSERLRRFRLLRGL